MIFEPRYSFEIGLVTPQGIKYQDLYYTSSKCIENKWFEMAEKVGEWRIPIIVQSSDHDEIIVFDIAVSINDKETVSPEIKQMYHQRMQEIKKAFYQSRNSKNQK